MLAGSSAEEGLLLYRLRRRGQATELVVGDLLLPEAAPSAARRLWFAQPCGRRVRTMRLGLRTTPTSGLLPLPGQGPMLTWRALAAESMPPLGEWRLSLGDIELF